MRFTLKRNVFLDSCKIKIVFYFILIIFMGACAHETIQVRPKYSGDHTTGQIRGMWWICYNTRLQNMPYFPPPVHMEHCDCVVDKSREKYSSSDYDKIGSDNLTKFFTITSIECDNGTDIKPEPTSI